MQFVLQRDCRSDRSCTRRAFNYQSVHFLFFPPQGYCYDHYCRASSLPFPPSPGESRSGCDCSGLTSRVAVRFQTPSPPPAPRPLPPGSAPRREQPIGRAELSGTITAGGARVPGSRPRPPARPRGSRPPAGSPPPRPPRGPSGRPGPPPAPTMYAFVRFLEDNVCYALPVSCVRDFSPRSRLDFDNQKVYAVYRGPEELGAGPESPPRAPRDWGALLLHKAQILALAGERAGREGPGDGAGAGTGEGARGSHCLLRPLLLCPRLCFGGRGVSRRPDQLKSRGGPLCLPRLPPGQLPRCQSVPTSVSALLFLSIPQAPSLCLSRPTCVYLRFCLSPSVYLSLSSSPPCSLGLLSFFSCLSFPLRP